MREVPALTCGGARLQPLSLASPSATSTSTTSVRCRSPSSAVVRALELSERTIIAERVVKEINARSSSSTSASTTCLHRSSADPRRRRGAAHPPRLADRQRARRRALRARRAVHRPAPARQPAAHRTCPPARPRQHGARGGARRGHHPRRRPGWSTSGRAPASTAANVGRRHRPIKLLKNKASLTGQYLAGRNDRCRPCAAGAGGAVARHARRGEQPGTSTSTSARLLLHRVTGVSGSGQVHARERHPLPGR